MSEGQQTTVATKERPTTISGFLEKYRSQIEKALPQHVTVDRMSRMALTAINSSSQLKKCTPESLFASIIIASQMGLEIGVQGQGYLIPYKDKATFVPGWQGIVDLVQRAGRALVWTGAVYEGDAFDWQLGDSPFIRHQPCGEDNPLKLTHAYAVGRVKGMDFPIIECWPADRIWTHRDKMNKVGESHYSFKHPEAYARKIPLLQVVKYLPKSIELRQALMAEDAAETGKGMTIDMDTAVIIPEGDDAGTHEEPRQTARERAAAAAGRTSGHSGNSAPAGSGEPEREPGE